MARPRSVHIWLGKRPTWTSVRPLLTARLIIAAARFILSSSETPEGLARSSNNSLFSASAAACLRIYSAAFSASSVAIFFIKSAAVGKTSPGVLITQTPFGQSCIVGCRSTFAKPEPPLEESPSHYREYIFLSSKEKGKSEPDRRLCT